MGLKKFSILAVLSPLLLFSNETSIAAKTPETVSPCNAPCDARPCPPPKPPSVCGFEQRFQIGGNYTYAWVKPDGNPSTSGSLGGLQAIYEYRPIRSIYAAGAFSYRIGNTTNDVGSRELQDFNQQARLGYTYSEKNKIDRMTLFTGLGARFMAETVEVGTASVDYDYTEFYVPLGVLLERKITSYFTMCCNFQWMPQIFPTVWIEPLTGARWSLKYQLANFFVELPFLFTFMEEKYALSINPFFETWRNGASTAETLNGLSLALPGNTYYFGGVNVNFAVSF